MLDQSQFTLLIVSIALAAYLASLNEWHQKKIDVLTSQGTAFNQDTATGRGKATIGTAGAMAKQKDVINQQVEHFTRRFHQTAAGGLLLTFFVILLVVRILLWAWRKTLPVLPPEPHSGPRRLLWLDRTLLSVLAILLLQLCVFHLLEDLPFMLGSR